MAHKTRKTRKTRAYSAAPKRRKAASRRAAPKRRRAVAAAPKRRVQARRRRSNPKGFLSTPAVELGVAALLGMGVGAAADMAPRWSWLPDQLQAGHVVGAALAFAGYKLAKGQWRQRLIAAGIGSAGQSFVRATVAPALAGVLGGAADDGSNAFPRSATVRYLRPGAPRMQAQSAALAANGLIR
jgi:hypothetical protein